MPRGGQVEVQRLDLATVVAAGKELHSFPPRHQWDLHLKKAHVLVNNTHFWVLSRWQWFQHSVQGNCWQQQLVYLSFLLWNSSDPKNFSHYAFIMNNKVLLCLYSNIPLPLFPSHSYSHNDLSWALVWPCAQSLCSASWPPPPLSWGYLWAVITERMSK